MFDRARPMFGVLSDGEIAAIVGAAIPTVASWRRRLGIAKPVRKGRVQDDPEVRYHGITARLGVESDRHIADDYGISRERVRQFRARFGIPRTGSPVDMPPDGYAMLGKVPDSHIAEFLDIPTGFVRRERVRACIPAATTVDFYERVIGDVRDRVGVDSDRSIAQDLNIPAAQLVNYRRRHDIAPAVLSPRCEGFVPHDRGLITRRFHEGATDAQIAVELGTTACVVSQIRTGELELFRGARQPRIDPTTVVEIHRRLDQGDTPWRIATSLELNPSTVAGIARRRKSKT